MKMGIIFNGLALEYSMGIDPWQMVENAKIRTDYRLKSY